MGARQVWLVLSALAYACDAASSGAKICDALNVCNFRKFNFSCPTGMQLVAAPTRNDNYTFRTADTPYAERAHDPTTYTPGVLNELHLRVMPAVEVHRPAAVRSAGGRGLHRRGREPDRDADRRVDGAARPTSSTSRPCGDRAVTHMDANAKAMHHRFHWRRRGLGRVTFRLLLKWGETNGGNFYWPMTAGDLTLDEGAIVDANASASWWPRPRRHVRRGVRRTPARATARRSPRRPPRRGAFASTWRPRVPAARARGPRVRDGRDARARACVGR